MSTSTQESKEISRCECGEAEDIEMCDDGEVRCPACIEDIDVDTFGLLEDSEDLL